MKNKVTIVITRFIVERIDFFTGVELKRHGDIPGLEITKDIWEKLSTEEKKDIVIAKCNEVEELYPDAPIIGLFDEIYEFLTGEGPNQKEIEKSLKWFAEDTLFRTYSENDLEEMVKHYSIAKLDD